MNMTRVGLACGMGTGLILLFVLIKLAKKDRTGRCRYDERQQLVQGRGFKYGFWAWGCFNFINMVMDFGFHIQLMDLSLLLFGGFLFGALFYASYCIWHEGYFSMNAYPKRVVVLFVMIMVMNLFCAAGNAQNGLFKNGRLSFPGGANLFCAAAFLLIFAVMLLKYYVMKRKTEEA